MCAKVCESDHTPFPVRPVVKIKNACKDKEAHVPGELTDGVFFMY